MCSQVTLHIALRWSENQTTKEPFSRLVIQQVTLSSNTPHGAGFTIAVVIHSVDPLERGNLDISYSIYSEDYYRARYSLA